MCHGLYRGIIFQTFIVYKKSLTFRVHYCYLTELMMTYYTKKTYSSHLGPTDRFNTYIDACSDASLILRCPSCLTDRVPPKVFFSPCISFPALAPSVPFSHLATYPHMYLFCYDNVSCNMRSRGRFLFSTVSHSHEGTGKPRKTCADTAGHSL